jgi:hypothetical protein
LAIKKEDKQKLINALLGGLCDKYNDLKRNKGYTDFAFSIDDIRKPIEKGGLGLVGLLQLIDKEDRIIKMLDADRFQLTTDGINRSKQMYPWMS